MGDERKHVYQAKVTWTDSLGSGTRSYTSYQRNHVISAAGKPDIPASADPLFRGDAARYNPEELLIAAVAACHMLWYLHLCAEAGIVVTSYKDQATGLMVEGGTAGGRFTAITLRPMITIACGVDVERARTLHATAHERCFIANSLNVPVTIQDEVYAEIQNVTADGQPR